MDQTEEADDPFPSQTLSNNLVRHRFSISKPFEDMNEMNEIEETDDFTNACHSKPVDPLIEWQASKENSTETTARVSVESQWSRSTSISTQSLAGRRSFDEDDLNKIVDAIRHMEESQNLPAPTTPQPMKKIYNPSIVTPTRSSAPTVDLEPLPMGSPRVPRISLNRASIITRAQQVTFSEAIHRMEEVIESET